MSKIICVRFVIGRGATAPDGRPTFGGQPLAQESPRGGEGWPRGRRIRPGASLRSDDQHASAVAHSGDTLGGRCTSSHASRMFLYIHNLPYSAIISAPS